MISHVLFRSWSCSEKVAIGFFLLKDMSNLRSFWGVTVSWFCFAYFPWDSMIWNGYVICINDLSQILSTLSNVNMTKFKYIYTKTTHPKCLRYEYLVRILMNKFLIVQHEA